MARGIGPFSSQNNQLTEALPPHPAGILRPALQDLVPAVARLVSQAPLVAILFSRLDVQWLLDHFALLEVLEVYPFEQRAIVLPRILGRKKPRPPLRSRQFHRRHAARAMTSETGLSVLAVLQGHLRNNVVAEVCEVTEPLRSQRQLLIGGVALNRDAQLALEFLGQQALSLTGIDSVCNGDHVRVSAQFGLS